MALEKSNHKTGFVNKSQRYFALDVFRGMTIALMILVNTPGSWAYVYAPLRHAKWHGLTPTDLVFPFFLFILGTAMVFSFSKFDFCRTKKIYLKIIKRTVIIFFVGIAIQLFSVFRQGVDFEHFRIMGVLQRIALAYGIAALLVLWFKIQYLWIIVITTLIGYWQLLLWTGGFELETNFVRTVDLAILGENHLWRGNGIPFDPEGLLSTLPSIITVILGFFAGVMIHTAEDQKENVKKMFILGIGLTLIGWMWNFTMPINKQLWTSSYVLVSAGIAFIILTILIWIIDINGNKKPYRFFEIFGTNSLFVFAASGLWVNIMLWIRVGDKTLYSYMYSQWLVPIAGDLNGSLLFAIAHVAVWWLILNFMYHKKIFIKI